MRLQKYDTITASSSAPCSALVNSWINNCVRSHECQRYRDQSLADWMPTRMVYCGPEGPLRLQECDEIKPGVPYMTLSHCWGQTKNTVCLTSKTLARWKTRLPDLSSVKTFHDAIAIAQACGIAYVWIDSLVRIHTFLHFNTSLTSL